MRMETVEIRPNGGQQVEVHVMNSGVPGVVQENFEGYYIDHDDLALAEVLQDQESALSSLQLGSDKASSSTNSKTDTVQKESSDALDPRTQLEVDEAIARALQDEENNAPSVTEAGNTSSSSSENREANTTHTPALASGQDDIDTDNMTYEELRLLGESIGTESKGLSDEVISYLPTSKYKIGLFSRKEKREECVICYMAYKNKDTLITLPCQHEYHSKCITRWLKINRECPVCKVEVFGS
ncbi:E3 ubiquitin ligase BIG BROTHER [Acorus calamus]|uniref:E3 ubiquitin ligase BIG BROTHER n=1 Tax=Acorus calamus TaxID=4465 RepID=A0AAV9F7P6_ACOCL|nr:E3 ubiquitin ligase BIG BROTHER [Acorus calamus]